MTIYLVMYVEDTGEMYMNISDQWTHTCIDNIYLHKDQALQRVLELKNYSYCAWVDEREVII